MSDGSRAEAAWSLVLAAHAGAASLDNTTTTTRVTLDADGRLTPATGDRALLEWRPGGGWHSLLAPDDPRGALVDLYLPLCSAAPSRPLVIGHLGQSLDGFIATSSGESRFVTGPENMVHMHRLRALSDAVVVGAGTVAADDPQLTTRLIPGENPLRVIFDPERRVPASARVFTDGGTPTLYASAGGDGPQAPGHAEAIALTSRTVPAAMAELLAALRARGCTRIFVEGGGVTVSSLVEAGLLDRLQITLAPVLIGQGRPGIRLAAPDRLRRLPTPGLPRLPHGRRHPVRLRPSNAAGRQPGCRADHAGAVAARSWWPTPSRERPASTCARRRSSHAAIAAACSGATSAAAPAHPSISIRWNARASGASVQSLGARCTVNPASRNAPAAASGAPGPAAGPPSPLSRR